MSLRPVISGFDFQLLHNNLGSKDAPLLAGLLEECDASVKFDDPTLTATAREVLRRAVFEGSRWSDLEVEGEAHVMAAIVLARHGQEHLPTGSDFWKMPAFWAFIREYHERLPDQARRALYVFGRGRALFGRRIETPWSFYGFLFADQIQALDEALVGLRAEVPELRGPLPAAEFVGELIGWLATIRAAEKDLWFYCH